MKSSRKPSKVSARSLVQKTITLRTSIELKLESFIKDPKIERTLEEISSFFKKIEDVKEKAEHLQEFQKCEKTLSSIVEKLQRHQELIPKYEEKIKELLDKRSSLKTPDKDDQSFEDDKKKIEEAITYIETTLKTVKEKLDRLSGKTTALLKQRDNLQAELEQFGLLAGFKECEKEAKKLGERLESVCKSAAYLSSQPTSLQEATKTTIKAFIPGFKTSLGKSNDWFAAVERNLGLLLEEGVAAPSRIIPSAAIPKAGVVVAMPAPLAAMSVQPSSPAAIAKPEAVAEAVATKPFGEGEAANEAMLAKAGLNGAGEAANKSIMHKMGNG